MLQTCASDLDSIFSSLRNFNRFQRLSANFCLERMEYELQTILSDHLKFNMRRHLRNFSRSCLQFYISCDLFFKQRSDQYDSDL